jgi:4'-phosphopantetheinyl transferase
VVSAFDGVASRRLAVAATMSRSGGWALLGLEVPSHEAEPAAFGVDLALVADFRRALPVAAFSRAERRRLSQSNDAAAEAARLWARKEALLKAAGTGLAADPAAVETLGDLRVREIDTRSLGLPEGFVAAVYSGSAGRASA